MRSAPDWVALAVDWNGTIVDDAERAWRATSDALSAVDRSALAPASIAVFRKAFTLPMETFFEGLGVEGTDVEECVRLWNAAMLNHPAELTPGARDLLEVAKAARVPVIVVSGAHEQLVHQDARMLEVAELISRVHGSAHPKRDVLRQYALRGRVAYVGDTSYDIAEGTAAGATTVAVDFGYGDSEDLTDADMIVSDLSTLVSMIGGSA